MSCCGKQREEFYRTNEIHRAHNLAISTTTQPRVTHQFVVCFEYVGKTGLTVRGPVSGKRYRFDSPGARVIVDP